MTWNEGLWPFLLKVLIELMSKHTRMQTKAYVQTHAQCIQNCPIPTNMINGGISSDHIAYGQRAHMLVFGKHGLYSHSRRSVQISYVTCHHSSRLLDQTDSRDQHIRDDMWHLDLGKLQVIIKFKKLKNERNKLPLPISHKYICLKGNEIN